ncbi:MAG: hypothetical protein JW965_01225 [Bacteroidales bacterium]|nr:hypothetical protein [Bacteroidales bacterium]
MPESTIIVTNQLSFITDKYNRQISDLLLIIAVYSSGCKLKLKPDISAGTRTMNSGAGSATFCPDSCSPDARITVSEFSHGDYTLTGQNGYCIYNAAIEVAFFGVPVANSGFNSKKNVILHINLTSHSFKLISNSNTTGIWVM